MKEEKLTYEILEKHFREQDRLIAEGKMQRPKIVYGFSPEGQKEFDKGITWDHIFGNKRNNSITR